MTPYPMLQLKEMFYCSNDTSCKINHMIEKFLARVKGLMGALLSLFPLHAERVNCMTVVWCKDKMYPDNEL